MSLGQCLIQADSVDPAHLMKAAVMRHREYASLARVLLVNGWVGADDLVRAQSRQWNLPAVNPGVTLPDPRLIDIVGAEYCLRHNLLPMRRIGKMTWVATSDPAHLKNLITDLPAELGEIRMLLCREDQVQASILSLRRTALIRRAEARVPERESCRTRNGRVSCWVFFSTIAATALGAWHMPWVVLMAFTVICALGLLAQSGLKLICFILALQTARHRRPTAARSENVPHDPEQDVQLPVISVLVPLFQESDVANDLVARLTRIRYPQELMDVLIVVECNDKVTLNALNAVRLPRWIRVIEVPDGPIRTKPRALNYALNFCKGSIVGIWDAEDRPDSDQLHRIARHFHFAAQDLGCVQGALDYYNPRSNWLARCFTIEYAAWFRVLLPSIERLGLVIPLGGTTCFFRRETLDDVDAWDAWNVTRMRIWECVWPDADGGLRSSKQRPTKRRIAASCPGSGSGPAGRKVSR